MSVALLLDEMHAPTVAETLRARGRDVISVAEDPELRGKSDAELLSWAATHKRRLVTENVKDFRPPLRLTESNAENEARVLFTSSRTFPRSRRNPGPLIDALDAWMSREDAKRRPAEDWLTLASLGP